MASVDSRSGDMVVAAEEAPKAVVRPSSLEQRMVNPDVFLYTTMVSTYLGERASAVVELLVCKGRLTVKELHSYLPLWTIKSLKTILVSLLQLRCVQTLDESSLTGKSTVCYYYFNKDGVLLWLYSALIIEEAGKLVPQLNGIAQEFVQTVLLGGSVTLSQYLEKNGVDEPTKRTITAAVTKLCETGLVVPLSIWHYTPLRDLWNRLYEKEFRAIPTKSALSDLKKRAEAKSKAKEQFNKMFHELNDASKLIMIDPHTSMRTIKPDVPLTINLDRFLKARRTKHLAHFAKKRVGHIPAIIYEVALKMTEQKTPPVVDPLTKTGLLQELDEAQSIKEDNQAMEQTSSGLTFSAADIAKYLPDSLDLRGKLITKLVSNKRTTNFNASMAEQPSKKLKTEDGFVIPTLPNTTKNTAIKQEERDGAFSEEHQSDDDLDIDDETDAHSVSIVNAYLRLISSSGIPFLNETKPGTFYIPYSKLMPVLRAYTYDYIIASTLGPSAARVRRCVIENSLVSEKVINSMGLMREKDIRSTISFLLKYNVLEVQEVPRTADRSASRAMFLFRSREKHSYDFMKQNLAWDIGNLQFKKKMLKDSYWTLLVKANRDDVKGREEELLLPSELSQLKMLNDRELNIWARTTRLISLWELFEFY